MKLQSEIYFMRDEIRLIKNFIISSILLKINSTHRPILINLILKENSIKIENNRSVEVINNNTIAILSYETDQNGKNNKPPVIENIQRTDETLTSSHGISPPASGKENNIELPQNIHRKRR